MIESAQGLFEASETLLVLLSFLLSRMLFGSPLIARALDNPEVLDPELDSGLSILELTLELEVSMDNPGFGDLPLPDGIASSSVQPAGVGGTGPSDDIGPGLRDGGDASLLSLDRFMLCDLGCGGGGGPGGGGGSGIPGSHLVVEDAREWVDGVLMAPVEAALLEAGGRESSCDWSDSEDGASMDIGTGRLGPAMCCSLLTS